MSWSKLKIQLESFLNPSVIDRVSYNKAGYRYGSDKKKQVYLLVDKKEIFNSKEKSFDIIWYENEQAVKEDDSLYVKITEKDLLLTRKKMGNKIPEERLKIVAKKNKTDDITKAIFKAQTELYKTDFQSAASKFLSLPIEACLESNDILLNIFALMDRRVGKKRIQSLSDVMLNKHPVVRYFYKLRR